MCSPGLEVEVELAAPLALGRSVGDDDLERVIADLVGNAAPAVEEVPQVGVEGWIGKSNAHGEESRLASWPVRGPRLTADGCPDDPSRSSAAPATGKGGCRSRSQSVSAGQLAHFGAGKARLALPHHLHAGLHERWYITPLYSGGEEA